jgi:hypothetical protein
VVFLHGKLEYSQVRVNIYNQAIYLFSQETTITTTGAYGGKTCIPLPMDCKIVEVLGVSITAAVSASLFGSGTIKAEAGLSPLLL